MGGTMKTLENWRHPTGCRAPRSVAIVALGQSSGSYVHWQLEKGRDPASIPDEVWTVNRGIRVFAADLAFVLDEIGPEIDGDPAYGAILQKVQIPIISTVCDSRVGNCHRYPAAQILDCIAQIPELGLQAPCDPYWHNSMPMVLAYAWFIGIREVTLWGCDYQTEHGHTIEANRANLEYWVGWVRARGMRVGVPLTTTLLNQRETRGELRIYGLRDQRRAADWLKE